jgi:hypothetical protein
MTDVDAEDWRFTVDGQRQPARPAFGFARAFDVEGNGPAVLRHERTTASLLLAVGQIVVWLLVARIVLAEAGRRRWRRRSTDAPVVER